MGQGSLSDFNINWRFDDTRRKWVDFMSFDPRIKDPKARCFIRRFEPSAEQIAEVESGAREFLAYVETIFQTVAEAA